MLLHVMITAVVVDDRTDMADWMDVFDENMKFIQAQAKDISYHHIKN